MRSDLRFSARRLPDPVPFLATQLLLTAALSGPAAALPERVERQLACMGTTFVLEVDAAERARALAASEAAVRAVEAVEQRLSTWRDDSELARLNAAPVGAPLTLSAELASDLTAARKWWAATRGSFDPGVGALVDAWGLRTGGTRPSEAALERARESSGMHLLEMRDRTVVRRHAGLRIEEGGFGKGIALDAAVRALVAAGADAARVDLGGQVAVLGRPVLLAIAHPDERERAVLTFELDRGSVATSGNAERGIVIDGVRHGHLLDPRTGMPCDDFGSVTVWAMDATAADCLSTALFAMGGADALRWVEARDGIEALILEPSRSATSAGALRARASSGLRGRLQPLETITIEYSADVQAPAENG